MERHSWTTQCFFAALLLWYYPESEANLTSGKKKKKMRWRATTQAIDSYGNAFRRCTQSLQMFFFYDTYIECLYATIYVRAAPYVLSPNVLN